MRRFALAAVALGAVGAVTAVAGMSTGDRAAQAARGPVLTPLQQRLMSGFASRALEEQTRRRAQAALRAAAAGGVGPTAETGCPANRGANVRVNQNCQNLTDPDLAGRGQAQNETSIAQDPNDPRTSSRRRTTTAAATASATRRTRPTTGARGRTRRRRWASPAGTRSAASRASTGRPAATRRWRGTRRATPTCPARCSTAGRRVSHNPDQSSAFYVFRSTGTGGASWNFPAPAGRRAQRRGGGRRRCCSTSSS